MGNLELEFLKQTISNLQSLQNEIFGEAIKILPEDFFRRYFRQLHTLKGTSKTFNFNHLALIVHEIEDLLQAIQNNQIAQNQTSTKIFRQSFVHLIKIAECYQTNSQIIDYTDFIKQIRDLNLNINRTDEFKFSKNDLPQNLLAKLSNREKSDLDLAFHNGNNLYVLEVNFQINNFADEFKNLKLSLENRGQTIAVFPDSNEKQTQTIGFQIIYTAKLLPDEIKNLTKEFLIKITFQQLLKFRNSAENVAGLFENLITAAAQNAFQLNKKITFETFLDDVELSENQILLLNQIATHLLNNAVDHAIETVESRILQGKNEIATIGVYLSKVENQILLTIEDDGRGIEKENLPHIFEAGFSTKLTVSEISGRGIGLDAVKDSVEKAGGRIEIDSKPQIGAKFSVYLPFA